jgi:predicted flavoprotein YhiN
MVDVIVVGARGRHDGVGLIASRGLSVLLLEKNGRLGTKLRITGKGRCNVNQTTCTSGRRSTTSDGRKVSPERIRERFFHRPIAMAFFERLGGKLKTERGGRACFPASDRAEDIAAALCRYVESSGVSVGRGFFWLRSITSGKTVVSRV